MAAASRGYKKNEGSEGYPKEKGYQDATRHRSTPGQDILAAWREGVTHARVSKMTAALGRSAWGTSTQNNGPLPRLFINGVRIDAVTLADTISIIDHWIKNNHQSYIVLTGAHGVIEMSQDEQLKRINNAAGLVTPDGMSVVWVAKSRGFRSTEKICASNIMQATIEVSVVRGYKHFFYGGAEGVADLLAAKLKRQHPGFNVAARCLATGALRCEGCEAAS